MKNPSPQFKLSALFYGLGVLAAMAAATALAQDPGKHALDYTYAEGSPQYWRGMHSSRPGNFVFRKDPHVWVVTPDFAKKSGLPLEWASEELQGVTAAAWRMQPGEEQCGWGGNPKACKRDMVCTLDLYFDRQTQVLPWAPNRPVADFYWQEVSSAWHLLPSLGWAQEANGDVARGSVGSLNYPNLGKSPFADPKTGEELLWNTSVIAYDREMHGRYAFVKLSLGCMGSLGSEPHETRKFRLETKTSRSDRYSEMGRSTERPELAKFVHHTFTLPASWDKRIGPIRKAVMQGTEDFYQNSWNTINKGDTK